MSGYKTIGDSTLTSYATGGKLEAEAVAAADEVTTSGTYQTTLSAPVKDLESGPIPVASGGNDGESARDFPSNLYFAPFDWSSQRSLPDRFRLVWESARPWGEFFDFYSYSIPKVSQLRERLTNNLEVYFSNYVIVAALYVSFFFLIHPLGVVSLLGTVCLALWFYGAESSTIRVGNYTLNPIFKHVIMAVVLLLALFFFNAFGVFMDLFYFSVLFVCFHALMKTPSNTTI